MKNTKKPLLIAGIATTLVVALAGGAYFLFGNKHLVVQNTTGQMFAGGFNRANFGFANGVVDSISGDNVIIDQANNAGQSIIVVSTNTNISKSVQSTQADVVSVGSTVIIQGTRTGTSIQATTLTTPFAIVRPSNRPTISGGFMFRRNGGMGGGGQNQYGANTFIGKITVIDGNTITLQTASNSTYSVTVDSSTTYNKQIKATLTDIMPNEKITAIGMKTTAGTINARNVTLM